MLRDFYSNYTVGGYLIGFLRRNAWIILGVVSILIGYLIIYYIDADAPTDTIRWHTRIAVFMIFLGGAIIYLLGLRRVIKRFWR